MVVKLEGKIDGQKIIFKRREGDWWETTIPKKLNGIYVVELVATDDAGNVGFATKYILTVDLNALCVHLKPLQYSALLEEEVYSTETKISYYFGEFQESRVCSEFSVSDFYATIVKKQECEDTLYGSCI